MDDVDRCCCAPPIGFEPTTFCSTGSCSGRLSYGGIALRRVAKQGAPWASNPVLRVKSPVPYQSGVTREVGREGIEPPVSDDGWSTASCAPWRDRPVRDRCGDRSHDDASAVVKVLVSRLVAGRVEAGSEGVEPSAIGFGSRGTTVAQAQVESARMTWCAW